MKSRVELKKKSNVVESIKLLIEIGLEYKEKNEIETLHLLHDARNSDPPCLFVCFSDWFVLVFLFVDWWMKKKKIEK